MDPLSWENTLNGAAWLLSFPLPFGEGVAGPCTKQQFQPGWGGQRYRLRSYVRYADAAVPDGQ